MLDTEKIKNIMTTLADEDRLFSCEAQFQLDFAWQLKDRLSGCDIALEYLWKNDNEKRYVDIIVFDIKERKCIPIELKYKTLNKELEYKIKNQSYWTNNQGAPDCGSYDYLKDIYRLETLGKSIKYLGEEYQIVYGYAIILTNDKHYFEKLPDYKDNNKWGYKYYYWEEFALTDQSIKTGTINWVDPKTGTKEEKGTHTTEDRKDPICLKNRYKLEWNDYKLKFDDSCMPSFKYLITIIPPGKN